MKQQLSFLFLFLFSVISFSQPELISGQWEGHLLLNNEKLPIKMNLGVKSNGVLSGYSIVQLKDGRDIEMKVKGQLHFDRSLTIREMTIVNENELEGIDWYKKNFQLVFKRDLWEFSMNGYWQQQVPQMLTEQDKRGRIFLKRVLVKA